MVGEGFALLDAPRRVQQQRGLGCQRTAQRIACASELERPPGQVRRRPRIGGAEGARGLVQRAHGHLVAGLGAGGQLSGDLHRRGAGRQ
jgi:hypothetical protein